LAVPSFSKWYAFIDADRPKPRNFSAPPNWPRDRHEPRAEPVRRCLVVFAKGRAPSPSGSPRRGRGTRARGHAPRSSRSRLHPGRGFQAEDGRVRLAESPGDAIAGEVRVAGVSITLIFVPRLRRRHAEADRDFRWISSGAEIEGGGPSSILPCRAVVRNRDRLGERSFRVRAAGLRLRIWLGWNSFNDASGRGR
jgi:hypothetical protein